MRRFRTVALMAALALLLAGASGRGAFRVPGVRAAQSWGVLVGGDQAPGITDINFYPRTVTINAGDAVSFTFPAKEPHTVTFDAGQLPGLFFTGTTPDNPTPGALDFTKGFSPLNASGPNITYDGSRPLSSGIPQEPADERAPFAVTFPKAGTYRYECAFHGPLMDGYVTVLASGAATPETPAQAKARGDAEAKADLTNTTLAAEAFPIMPQKTAGPSGTTLHTLMAGIPGFHQSVVQFAPADYTVKRGDYITWSQPDPNQFHSVTFLSGAPAPAFLQVIPQPNGPPLLVLPANVNLPSGGNAYAGTGMVNSGTLTPANSWTVRMDAPPGTYEYVCLFHVDDYNMKGTITVTP